MTEEQKTISFFEKLKMRYDAYHECFLKPVWQERFLKYRFRFLTVMAGVGIILAFIIYFLTCWLRSPGNNLFFNNLTFLALSLPVLVLLWFYRTHDVQEQIDKAQSNINTNLFNKGIDLLLTKDTKENNNVNKRSAGLRMLVKLRQQEETLRQQIDALTNGVDLSNANLYGADLSNADLFDANLSDADLQGSNLRGTDLLHADLSNADLSDADLSDADLSDADLRAKNLEDANLQGAKFNQNTKFYQGFDPEGAGMIKDDDDDDE